MYDKKNQNTGCLCGEGLSGKGHKALPGLIEYTLSLM